jgi:hypothetical protein
VAPRSCDRIVIDGPQRDPPIEGGHGRTQIRQPGYEGRGVSIRLALVVLIAASIAGLLWSAV